MKSRESTLIWVSKQLWGISWGYNWDIVEWYGMVQAIGGTWVSTRERRVKDFADHMCSFNGENSRSPIGFWRAGAYFQTNPVSSFYILFPRIHKFSSRVLFSSFFHITTLVEWVSQEFSGLI
jgi:hypothetical protein